MTAGTTFQAGAALPLPDRSAVELARLLRAGEVSAREVPPTNASPVANRSASSTASPSRARPPVAAGAARVGRRAAPHRLGRPARPAAGGVEPPVGRAPRRRARRGGRPPAYGDLYDRAAAQIRPPSGATSRPVGGCPAPTWAGPSGSAVSATWPWPTSSPATTSSSAWSARSPRSPWRSSTPRWSRARPWAATSSGCGRASRVSVTACPALSLPAGTTAAGLPVGVQVVGRHRGERQLLRAALALEAAVGWAGRRPPPAARGRWRAASGLRTARAGVSRRWRTPRPGRTAPCPGGVRARRGGRCRW